MPNLLCETHGLDQLEDAKSTDWSEYPGEYTKIAKGKLKDSYLCDKCNASLSPGETAYFVGYYPEGREDSDEVDYFTSFDLWIFSENHKDFTEGLNFS